MMHAYLDAQKYIFEIEMTGQMYNNQLQRMKALLNTVFPNERYNFRFARQYIMSIKIIMRL